MTSISNEPSRNCHPIYFYLLCRFPDFPHLFHLRQSHLALDNEWNFPDGLPSMAAQLPPLTHWKVCLKTKNRQLNILGLCFEQEKVECTAQVVSCLCMYNEKGCGYQRCWGLEGDKITTLVIGWNFVYHFGLQKRVFWQMMFSFSHFVSGFFISSALLSLN